VAEWELACPQTRKLHTGGGFSRCQRPIKRRRQTTHIQLSKTEKVTTGLKKNKKKNRKTQWGAKSSRPKIEFTTKKAGDRIKDGVLKKRQKLNAGGGKVMRREKKALPQVDQGWKRLAYGAWNDLKRPRRKHGRQVQRKLSTRRENKGGAKRCQRPERARETQHERLNQGWRPGIATAPTSRPTGVQSLEQRLRKREELCGGLKAGSGSHESGREVRCASKGKQVVITTEKKRMK